MSVATQLAYMLALLSVGAGLRVVGVLTEHRRDRLTAVAFYVALPALVFTSTVNRSLSDVLVWRLFVGVTAVYLAVTGIGWVVHRGHEKPAQRGVAVVQSYHCNMGFLGLPFVAASFSGVTVGKASVIHGFGSLIQITLTVLLLTRITNSDADVVDELGNLTRNPVLIALALGLTGGTIGLSLPGLLEDSLGVLGNLALPIALPAVGASLTAEGGLVDPPTVCAITTVKLLIMPVVALMVFTGLGASPTTLRAGVLMLAMPTAVSTYIYSSELNGDGDLASATVLTTTVVAVATLFGVVQVLGVLAP